MNTLSTGKNYFLIACFRFLVAEGVKPLLKKKKISHIISENQIKKKRARYKDITKLPTINSNFVVSKEQRYLCAGNSFLLKKVLQQVERAEGLREEQQAVILRQRVLHQRSQGHVYSTCDT